MEALEHFFSQLFARKELGNYLPFIEVRAIAPDWLQTNRRVFARFAKSVSDVRVHLDAIQAKDIPYNIFFGVLPRTTFGVGSKASITQGATLWVDIDAKTVGSKEAAYDLVMGRAARAVNCAPAFVVDSGNGVHGYWLLDRPVTDIALLEHWNKQLSLACGGDKTWDGTRVLRVPGTMNHKVPQCPTPVAILETNDTTLSPQTLESLFPISAHSQANRGRAPSSIGSLVPGAFSLDKELGRLGTLWSHYITNGIRGDTRNFYNGDRSRLDFVVVREMLKRGYSDEDIYAAFTNPCYLISEKTLEKPPGAREAYIGRTIDRARVFVEEESK